MALLSLYSVVCNVFALVALFFNTVNTIGVFWRDTLKVAKNFLGPKMPLLAFWQMPNFGETLSEEEEKVLGYL